MDNPKVTRSLLRRRFADLPIPPRQDVERGKWWREPLVYSLVFGIPLLLLAPVAWRPDAEFQAKVRTKAVGFTMGAYNHSGPFAGGDVRVDVTFEGFEKVELPAAEQWKPRQGKGPGGTTDSIVGGRLILRNVELRRLSAPSGTHVSLRWYDKAPSGVTIRLAYSVAQPIAAGQVVIGTQSTVEFRSSLVSKSAGPQDGLIQVTPEGQGALDIFAGSDARLSASVTPRPVASASPVPVLSGSAKIHGQPSDQATLPLEEHLPLLAGTGISFIGDHDGESEIFGDESVVEVSNADRKENVRSGQVLVIGGLRERRSISPKQSGSLENGSLSNVIGLQINAEDGKDEKQGIYVTLRGTAGDLWVNGSNKLPTPAEWLKANTALGLWLVYSILIGNTLLTILTRANFFSLTKINKL